MKLKAREADATPSTRSPSATPPSSDVELLGEGTPLLHKGGVGDKRVPLHALSLIDWLKDLNHHFGHELLLLLFATQHLLKGFGHSIVLQAEPYLFRSFGVPAPQVQIFTAVTSLPWAMKPVIGLISDVLPIRGLNKAPYMIITTVFGTLALASIFFVNKGVTVQICVAFIFLGNLQMSTCDLLSEAKYAEQIRERPARGPALLTYVWAGLQVGGLVAVAFSGPVLRDFGPKAAFLIAAVAAAAVIIPVMLGYVQERRLSAEAVATARRVFVEQPETSLLCFVILAGTMVLTILGTFSQNPRVNCTGAVCVALFVLVCFSVALSPIIAKFNAFAMIQSSLSVTIGGAAFYFFTDTPEQFPEGPHFSEFFYVSVMGTAGAVFSLLGIVCYQRYFCNWRYRQLLLMTNLICALMSLSDLILFARLNTRFGIPDHGFVLGSTILSSVINQWRWMPSVVILSFLCPKGMEATMYALLAGCHNLGNAVAANLGALLLNELGCRPSGMPGESEQFRRLWVASAFATAMPLVTILALFWLIPDARQDQNVLATTHSATEGSLWNQWRRKSVTIPGA